MAEVQQSQPKETKPGHKRTPTRIDMTAMVDVAFLLLTFFILTSQLSLPGSMVFSKPVNGPGTEVPCSKVMTLYLGAEDKVHWFSGCDASHLQTTGYSKDGIRDEVQRELKQNPELIITIKPTDASRYANLVDILDEMAITKAPRYAVAPMTDADQALLTSQGLK